jgi:hypothetical protein
MQTGVHTRIRLSYLFGRRVSFEGKLMQSVGRDIRRAGCRPFFLDSTQRAGRSVEEIV